MSRIRSFKAFTHFCRMFAIGTSYALYSWNFCPKNIDHVKLLTNIMSGGPGSSQFDICFLLSQYACLFLGKSNRLTNQSKNGSPIWCREKNTGLKLFKLFKFYCVLYLLLVVALMQESNPHPHQGFSGRYWTKDNTLVADVCTSLVGTDFRYKFGGAKHERYNQNNEYKSEEERR